MPFRGPTSGATARLGEDHDPETHLIPNVLAATLDKFASGLRSHVRVVMRLLIVVLAQPCGGARRIEVAQAHHPHAVPGPDVGRHRTAGRGPRSGDASDPERAGGDTGQVCVWTPLARSGCNASPDRGTRPAVRWRPTH